MSQPALRHCNLILTPQESVTFEPSAVLMLDIKVKYRNALVSLKESFQTVTHYTYLCKGTCTGIVYAWQGINFDGENGEVEKIGSKEYDLWASIIEGANDTRKKGASAVTGSQRFFPYSYREMIPV